MAVGLRPTATHNKSTPDSPPAVTTRREATSMRKFLDEHPHVWRKFIAHLKLTLPSVYGPRGMVMLGKAVMCVCFGISYVGILQTTPSPGLDMVRQILPLPLWGVVWFLCAFMLSAAAFKVDQSRALGCIAAMQCLWATSYLEYFLRVPVLPNGNPNTAFLSAALLASMALSAAGLARMMNHAPSHPEVVQKPGVDDD